MRVGDRIRVSAPKNHFTLKVDAPHTVLIAGGIGITPLLPMARQLAANSLSWELHLAVKNGSQKPLRAELDSLGAPVHVYETGIGLRPDLNGLVAQAPRDSHFYCCGPEGMLEDFVSATSGLPSDQVHMERFEAAASVSGSSTFNVELARSGVTLNVAADQSILDVLLGAGIQVDYSCSQGICGSCSVKLLDGEPDHRDEVLSESEREQKDQIMICCSRAKGDRLVLDL
jgi:vanillate O-demethylase ferredoxin subunit